MILPFKLPFYFVVLWLILAKPTAIVARVHRRRDASFLPLERNGGGKDETSATNIGERNAQQRSSNAGYRILSSLEIKQQLMSWKSLYPNFCRVTTAQEEYGLRTAGKSTDCPYENGTGCVQYIVTIQDYIAHPTGSNSSNRLPEVFWSGALHGDERVGPTSVIQAGALLLEAANCEAQSRRRAIVNCRASLLQQGIDDVRRRWLARLLLTRRVVIVPTANALGYYQSVREENGVDVNRDFPYDVQQSNLCMQSIAARTINEIFRDHLFQLSLTFHAGTELIGYEWGAPSWLNVLSPDDRAQTQIAAGFSRFAGASPTAMPYEYGDMNDVIYWVRGGMEDWAYAGSWTPSKVITCKPTTFGGYPAEKTKYNNSTLRSFNLLVETSYDKTPASNTLGSSRDILTAINSVTNGHVARNIRLALLSAELVEPYVSVVGVDQVPLSDRLPLTTTRGNVTDCLNTKVVLNSNSSGVRNKKLLIQWTVGGGFYIDRTTLYYAVLNETILTQLDCWSQPSSNLLAQFSPGQVLGNNFGTTYFSSQGPFPRASASSLNTSSVLGPLFQGTIDLSAVQGGTILVVLAAAQMDQYWTTQPSKFSPKVPPQSHVVNARTNPNWYHESAGKVIQGRRDWFSSPVLVSLPLR